MTQQHVIGAAVFVVLVFLAGLALTAIVRAMTAPRPAATFSRTTGGVPAERPCAVYEIDVEPDSVYVGHGFDPHQRVMTTHRRTAWWERASMRARATLQPDRVDWYPSEKVAFAEEIRRIRVYDQAGRKLENKILYRQGAAKR